MPLDIEYFKSYSSKKIYAYFFKRLLQFKVEVIKEEEDFEYPLQNKLRFENIYDRRRLECCYYILEDTEEANEDFVLHGLGERFQERYLRLYGVLNSVYTQHLAIMELADLFKLHKKKKEIKEDFKVLKILQLRNKIASHPSNFKKENENESFLKQDFYFLRQTSISKSGREISLLSGRENKKESYDLFTDLNEYHIYSNKLLMSISLKALNTIFKDKSKKRDELQEILNFLETNRGIKE